MSKSRNKYEDDYNDGASYNPYSRRSEYLEKKRKKRMQKALRIKDIDSLLQQNDDYEDNE
jgi:hypothetical protein